MGLQRYGRQLLLLCLVASRVNAASSKRYASLLAFRGGGGDSSPYELNPAYQQPKKSKVIMPPPAGNMNMNNQPNQHQPQQPFLPHEFHVETTTHQSVFPQQGPNFSDFQSLRYSFQQYLQRLYQTSPDLFAVAATSVGVFVLWQIPALHGFLQNHFICQQRNLKAGRLHVVLTSAVSHFSFFHLLFNMITLLNLGPQVKLALKTTSNWPLWPLMVGSALTGSISQAILGHRDGCLGLSGVTLGLFAVLARLYPQRIMSIRLMGIFPISMASQMLLRVVLIWSVLGSLRTRSNVAHIAHLGGIAFGLAFYEVWLRHRRLGSRAFWIGWKS